MNIKDIKVNETYNVRVVVEKLEDEYFECVTLNPQGFRYHTCFFCLKDAAAFSPIPAEPKYDPCRKFKKGDIVKKRWVDGRTDADLPFDEASEVCSDEDMYGNIRVQTPSKYTAIVKAVFVELVTPVEEIKPYSVFNNAPSKACEVRKANKTTVSFYYGPASAYTENEAEALAQAECDRLNAKHGKG